MTQRWIYFFGNGQADGSSDIKHLIGGKGASLADMTRAGLNVPPGFTISAECCDYYYRHDRRWPDDLEAEVRANLARLEQLSGRNFGVGARPLLVAVRSGAMQSMPGMMDTVLNVGLNPDCVRAMAERAGAAEGASETYRQFVAMFTHAIGVSAAAIPIDPWIMLRAAINAVFESWNSERAVTYRRHHQIDGLLGTAVTVQVMCPAEVAGVMFTANPVSQAAEIIIESSFGLGEAIVLGKVTPDRFVLDKHDLTLKECVIAHKDQRVAAWTEEGHGRTDAPDAASLHDNQIVELARLGMSVEAYFKTPCDIEWALSRGQFFLLQARAIKFRRAAPAVDPVEQERVRLAEVAVLKGMAEPAGTVWARFNLAEILPEPTPMTWAIVRRFMSGKGGFGQMYRDLGFDPDPALDEIGMFDLICGRPYCNLGREPRMQYRNMPFEHNFARLKKDPQKALYPQATFNPRRAGMMFFVTLPILFFKMWWSQIKQQQILRTFADDFNTVIVPRYLLEIDKATAVDLTKLTNAEVLARLEALIELTLFDFARHSLKPTALAALLFANLERSFAARLKPADVKPAEAFAVGLQKAQAALRELVIGVHPDEETDLPAAVRALQAGRLSKTEFLRRFGHRGSQEMELARPRWAEDHASLDSLTGVTSPHSNPAPQRGRENLSDAWQFAWLKLADEARLLPGQRPAVEAELRRLQAYMSLRETAKHHLMRGYALIRRALLELDRRYELDGGVFFLNLDGLADLVSGEPGVSREIALGWIGQARAHRNAALSLPVPSVIFSDDLDAIGRAATLTTAGALQGAPLSAGVVEASAWVLEEVDGAQMPHEPYILVCPSTDPAWVPLFVHAKGLVMETGGMLSHGAIVAREFGLPAVAGIADVHRRIKTGQRLRVDGGTGTVHIVG